MHPSLPGRAPFRPAMDELRRLRPLHTSAVIFASAAMSWSRRPFYVVQNLPGAFGPAIWRPGLWVVGYNFSSSSRARLSSRVTQ